MTDEAMVEDLKDDLAAGSFDRIHRMLREASPGSPRNMGPDAAVGLTKMLDGLVDEARTIGVDLSEVRDDEGNTLTHTVVGIMGSGSLVDRALDAGMGAPTTTNDRGDTPLHQADNPVAAAKLIAQGADPEARNEAGQAPLHTIEDGQTAHYLITTHGVAMDARDNAGRTPLHGAPERKAETLIFHGASVDARGEAGQTPLHTAQSHQAVRQMIEAGADPNALDNAGRTPMHTAKGSLPSLIMDMGGDPTARDEQGRAPDEAIAPNHSADSLVATNVAAEIREQRAVLEAQQSAQQVAEIPEPTPRRRGSRSRSGAEQDIPSL